MKENHLFDEIIRLGYKCNEKCLFCNFTPINEPWYIEKDVMDVQVEIDTLIKKHKHAKNISIYFSGGEPFLWWDKLLEMIAYAKKKWIWKVWIQSNATLISEKVAISLRKLGVDNILISLHSHKNEINDKITLHKDSTTQWLMWIKNLQKVGVSFIINHVLNKINYKHFSEFIMFLKSINVLSISLWIVQPHGYAEENFEKIVVSYDALYPYLKEGYDVAEQEWIELISHYCDIPLCKFEDKLQSDLNYLSLLEIRQKWISNYSDFTQDLVNSKTKVSACKTCKYNNYCYWVWTNYIKWFWDTSIGPGEPYISVLQLESQNLKTSSIRWAQTISDKNVCFFHKSWDYILKSLKQCLQEEVLVIQYYIQWNDFQQESQDFFINIITSWVNVINIDISDITWINISNILLKIKSIYSFSQANRPYYNVVIYVKSENQSIIKLLGFAFKEIIFV